MAGRPLKLRSLVAVAGPDGERVRKTVQQAICDEMEATGRSPMQCAEAVGVPRDTISQCLNDGRRLADKSLRMPADWVPLARRDQAVLEFFRAQQAAHSRWIADKVKLHATIARGDLVVSEVVEKVDPTRREDDPTRPGQTRPRVIEQRVTRRRTLPDAKAIEWELERLAREEVLDPETGRLVTIRPFAPRVEVTGAEGGPIQTEDVTDERARDLLAEIDAYEAGLSDAEKLAQERAGPGPG